MSRIEEIFDESRADGRTILMPFVTGGYPTLEVTEQVIPALEAAGAGIIEVGIPFSDPIADGPVIASSMHAALERGVTPPAVFDVIRRLRSSVELGLVAMLSHSIVNRMGRESFIADAAHAGFDGLIIPDIDTTSAASLRDDASGRGLTLSLLISPTTRADRLEQLVGVCTGFVYLLADVGITGEREGAPDIEQRVAQIRGVTDLPIAVGFGISCADHVQAATRHADAAIVGSALVRRMGEAEDPVASAEQFVRELAQGLGRRAPVGRS